MNRHSHGIVLHCRHSGAGCCFEKWDWIICPILVCAAHEEHRAAPDRAGHSISGMITGPALGVAASADGLVGVGGPIGAGGSAADSWKPNATTAIEASIQRRMGASFREESSGDRYRRESAFAGCDE
jgi:hypothetical protein